MEFINVNVRAWFNNHNGFRGYAMDDPYLTTYNGLLHNHLRDIEYGRANCDLFSILFTGASYGLNGEMRTEVNNSWGNQGNQEGRVYGFNDTDEYNGGRVSLGNNYNGRDLMAPWQALSETYGKPVVFWFDNLWNADGIWAGIRHDAPRSTWEAFNLAVYSANRDNRYESYKYIANHISLSIDGIEVSTPEVDAWFSTYEEREAQRIREERERRAIERIENAPYVADYHEGTRHGEQRPSYVGKDTLFSIGFEVEKEDYDVKSSINNVKFNMATGWDKERDGSLNSDGYEIVSPTYDLYDDRLDQDLKIDALREHIDGDYSKRCGGHIHLGAVGMTGRTFFDRFAPWLPLMYAVYVGRINGEHCKVKKNDDLKFSSDKYQSVRLFDNRIELRIPSAVSDTTNLLWRRDLLRIICDNLDATPLRIVSMLTDKRSRLYKHMSKVYEPKRMQEKLQLYVYFANEILDDAYTMIPERIPTWEKMFNKSQISHLRNHGFRQKSLTI